MLNELIKHSYAHVYTHTLYAHITRTYTGLVYITQSTAGGQAIIPHQGPGYHKQSLPVSREADQQVSAQLAVFTAASTLASPRLYTSSPLRGVCRLIGNRLLPVLSCQTRCPLTRKNNVRKIRKSPWPRRQIMAPSPRQLHKTPSP